jgi:hypothetical protein
VVAPALFVVSSLAQGAVRPVPVFTALPAAALVLSARFGGTSW